MFEIRKAVKQDAKQMAGLYLQFWEVHVDCDPLIRPKRKPNMKSETESALKDIRKRSNIMLVAQDGMKIIGFIEVNIKKNDEMFKLKEYAYLNSCAVDKGYRKKGVAKALTMAAVNEVRKRNIKYMKASVYNVNETAGKTWKSLGFEKISTNLVRRL